VDSVTVSPFGYSSEWPRLVDAVDVLERRGRGSMWCWATLLRTATTPPCVGRTCCRSGLTTYRFAERRAVNKRGITEML